MAQLPSLSLVLAVRDRPEQFALCLATLARQTDPEFELVVVDDASRTPLQALALPWPDQPRTLLRREASAGRAAARNACWRAAAGAVVCFLDSDILAQPGLAAAHRRGHARGGPFAVSGFPWSWREVQTVAQPAGRVLLDGRAAVELAAAEAAQGAPRLLPPEQAPFLAFVTRDVSVRREVVAGAGGFWEGFVRYGLADWELGYRLHRAGTRFLADPQAGCLHQAHPLPARRHLDNALNYALLLERHPDPEVALMALCPPWLDQEAYRRVCAALHRLRAIAPDWAAELRAPLLGHARAFAARAAAGHALPGAPPPLRAAGDALRRWRAARDPAVAPLWAALGGPGG